MQQKIFVGTAGWSYPDWKGVVYPPRLPRGKAELTYLADYLDAVEINTSFYRPPPAAMSEKWLKQVAAKPDFLFTAKLWQRFTHERQTPWTPADVEAFKGGMRPLHEAGRLGALLMQFPWSFPANDSSRDWLRRLSETFGEFPCVLEVRHASWDSDENREFLRRRRLNFCNIDQPKFRTSIKPTNAATGPVGYCRFHGRNAQAWFARDAGRNERYNYLYTESELTPWVKNVAALADQVEKLFVMTNNHYRGQAVVNALEMKSLLTGRKVSAPESLVEQYPDLGKFTAAARLF